MISPDFLLVYEQILGNLAPFNDIFCGYKFKYIYVSKNTLRFGLTRFLFSCKPIFSRIPGCVMDPRKPLYFGIATRTFLLGHQVLARTLGAEPCKPNCHFKILVADPCKPGLEYLVNHDFLLT